MNLLTALFVLLAGLFAIAGGVLNWDWFMTNRRARIFVAVFGRQGARLFYVLLGIIVVVFGALGLLGRI